MSNYAAYGTLLKKGDAASPEVFATIAQVTTVSGPSLALDAVEVTNHDVGWSQFVGGILRGGEVSFEINYDPAHATHEATSTGLVDDMVDRTVRNFQLVFPDDATTTWAFSALVTSFEPGAPVDDKLGASVTLTVSGQPTLA